MHNIIRKCLNELDELLMLSRLLGKNPQAKVKLKAALVAEAERSKNTHRYQH